MLNIKNWFANSARKPLIFAEIGINHGGDLSVAQKLSELAASAGVDVIKHQTHIPTSEMSVESEQEIIPYLGSSIFDLISNCSLNLDQEFKLKEFVENELGCCYVSTPFSRQASDFLDEIDIPFFKIGSGEAKNYHFVKHVASKGKPVFLSTGMSSVDQITRSVNALEEAGVSYLLFHTTNAYPCPISAVRLQGMRQLQTRFNTDFVGLSDHTESNSACLAALSVGALAVERHFTDSRERKGADIACSMTPAEAKQLVTFRDELGLLYSEEEKSLHSVEAEVKMFADQSVVAVKDLAAGDIIDLSVVDFMRPGGGDFGIDDINDLVGRMLIEPIGARTQLRRHHFGT